MPLLPELCCETCLGEPVGICAGFFWLAAWQILFVWLGGFGEMTIFVSILFGPLFLVGAGYVLCNGCAIFLEVCAGKSKSSWCASFLPSVINYHVVCGRCVVFFDPFVEHLQVGVHDMHHFVLSVIHCYVVCGRCVVLSDRFVGLLWRLCRSVCRCKFIIWIISPSQ